MNDAELGWSNQHYASNGFSYNAALGVTSNQGEVFLTGSTGDNCLDYSVVAKCSFVTTAYSRNGSLKWEKTMSHSEIVYSDVGRAVAVDYKNGYVYSTGYSGVDILITLNKYIASNGTLIWSHTYDSGRAYDIILDKDNDIIITGFTSGALSGYVNQGSEDIFTMKVGKDGSKLWGIQLGTTSKDQGRAIAYDPVSNEVLITGSTEGVLPGQTKDAGDTSSDYYIARYNASSGVQTLLKQVYDYYWYYNLQY